jgi:hypothetical protein
MSHSWDKFREIGMSRLRIDLRVMAGALTLVALTAIALAVALIMVRGSWSLL